jgi:hypothetical protein
MLRVIRIDNKNINLEMVKSGLAEAYSGKPPKDFDLTPYPCVSMTRWESSLAVLADNGISALRSSISKRGCFPDKLRLK